MKKRCRKRETVEIVKELIRKMEATEMLTLYFPVSAQKMEDSDRDGDK